MAKKENDGIALALDVELVGIKNLKSTHNWRLEFDVYESDSYKIKDLFEYIDQPVVIAIVTSKKDLNIKSNSQGEAW